MVKFYNISYDDNWVYADGWDVDLGVGIRFCVHRHRDEYRILSGDICSSIISSAWDLVDQLNETGNLPSQTMVCTH